MTKHTFWNIEITYYEACEELEEEACYEFAVCGWGYEVKTLQEAKEIILSYTPANRW